MNDWYLAGDSDRQAGVAGQHVCGVITIDLHSGAAWEGYLYSPDALAAEPAEGAQALPVARQHQ